MDQRMILYAILGMAAVTYLPRLLPAWFLSSRRLSPSVERWLSYVPSAVLAALLAPSLFLDDASLHISAENTFLLASIPTFFVAIKTGSFFGTVAAGMASVAVLRLLI